MESGERSNPAIVNAKGDMFEIKAESPYEIYLRDQMDRVRSVTDLHMVCKDGFVPVHRYILMGTSSLIKEALENLDPSELAVIHLPDVELTHIVQIISLLYAGKTVIGKDDQVPVFSAMRMLGITTRSFEFRASKPTDAASIPNLRSFPIEDGDIDKAMEQTYDTHQDQNVQSSSTSKPRRSEINSEKEVQTRDSIPQPSVDSGPIVLSKKRIDKEETARLSKLKVALPREKLVEIYKCFPCKTEFSSMEILLEHLKKKCARRLNAKYVYNDRQCLVCNELFPSFNIWALLRHVNECIAKFRSVPVPSLSSPSSRSEIPNVSIIEKCSPEKLDPMECLDSGSQSAISFPEVETSVSESINKEMPVEKRSNRIKDQQTQKLKYMEKESQSSLEREGLNLNEPVDSLETDKDKSDADTVNIGEPPQSDEIPSSSTSTVPRKRRRRRAVTSKRLKRKPGRPRSQIITTEPENLPVDNLDQEHEVENETEESAISYEGVLNPVPIEISNIQILGPERLGEQNAEVSSDEKDTSDEMIINPQFLCEIGEGATGSKQCRYIDPDTVRNELGIVDALDIPHLTAPELRNVFRQCPLCKTVYEKLKFVSKCLRQHGYRYCWVCLMLLPYKGHEFDEHSRMHHCTRETADKVLCPLCEKDFEYKLALPTHLGNFHALRIEESFANNLCGGQPPSTYSSSAALESENRQESEIDVPISGHHDPIAVAYDYNPYSQPGPKSSKLRDILLGPPGAIPTTSSTSEIRNTRKRSIENVEKEQNRDGRFYMKLGEQLKRAKSQENSQGQGGGESSTNDKDLSGAESLEQPMEQLSCKGLFIENIHKEFFAENEKEEQKIMDRLLVKHRIRKENRTLSGPGGGEEGNSLSSNGKSLSAPEELPHSIPKDHLKKQHSSISPAKVVQKQQPCNINMEELRKICLRREELARQAKLKHSLIDKAVPTSESLQQSSSQDFFNEFANTNGSTSRADKNNVSESVRQFLTQKIKPSLNDVGLSTGEPLQKSSPKDILNEFPATNGSSSSVEKSNAGSGRTFLTQKIIDGCTYDIFCLSGDAKKTIAIPAVKVMKTA